MRVHFIAKLYNMRIAEPLGPGIRFGSNLYISNNPVIVRDHIAKIAPFIGRLERDALLDDSTCFIYGRYDAPKGTEIDLESVAHHCLRQTQIICNVLWLVKDNAVETELGFAWMTDGPRIWVSSKLLFLGLTTASGEAPVTSFTREELRAARELASRLHHENKPVLALDPLRDEMSPMVFPKKDVTRFDMAFFTLQQVRATNYVPSKIVGYCTCFETLLSTDSTEMTHKIAERIAWLLGSNVAERLELYESARSAYSVRSKTVHGALPGSKDGPESLVRLSQWCDETLRRIIMRILLNKEMWSIINGPEKQLAEWFKKLCLGGYESTGDLQISSV